ncbi:glycosyl hydrolase family 61-domain-containing protein [Aspergillus heterothallicus]
MSIARLVGPSLASAAIAASLGYVTGIVVDDSKYYRGYLMTQYPYTDRPPGVIAWSENATDLGFINTTGYTGGDIICHQDAENAALYATITAGSTVESQWDDWADNHHGPVIEYLARCDTDCSTIDKYALKWFKISPKGLIDPVGSTGQGFWASNELITNNYSWSTTIPSSITPGNYVLRHAIIALHSASVIDGAQNYPQYFNLKFTSGGSDNPDDSYQIPDPTLHSSGSSSSTQSTSSTAVTTTPTPASPRIVTVTAASSATTTSTSAPGTEVFTSNTTATARRRFPTMALLRQSQTPRALRDVFVTSDDLTNFVFPYFSQDPPTLA